MFGINEYYDSLLLEAKSPEEIKKILTYKYVQGKNVPEIVFERIFNADPTKKKSYANWMLMHWGDEQQLIQKLILEDRLNSFFHYFQSRQNSGLNLTNIGSVKEAIEMLPDFDPVLSKKHKGGPEDDYDIVYDTPEWKIAVPHTYAASEKLGTGCRWCTAGAFGDGPGFYNKYTKYGPLWVNFDMRQGETCPMDKKEYPYTRYQFLFEYRNYYGELMDSNDDRIHFSEIDMPEEVVAFYEEKDERYKEVIDRDGYGDDEDEYDDDDGNYDYTQADWEAYESERFDQGTRIKTSPETGHDLWILEESNESEPICGVINKFHVYDSEDASDPISFEDIAKEPRDCVVFEFPSSYVDYPCVIIKTLAGANLVCFMVNNGYRDNYWECSVLKSGENTYGCNDASMAYFITDRNTLYVCGASGEHDYMSQVATLNTDFTVKDDVFDMDAIYNIEDDRLDDYKNGNFFEVDYANGYSGLYYIENDDIEMVIGKDCPIYEDGYRIELDEESGHYVVKGKFGKHYLSNWTMNSDYHSYDLEEELTDDVYSVKYDVASGERRYNLYNKKTNTFFYEVKNTSDLAKLPYSFTKTRSTNCIIFNFETKRMDLIYLPTLKCASYDGVKQLEGCDFFLGSNRHTPEGSYQDVYGKFAYDILDSESNIIYTIDNFIRGIGHGRFIVQNDGKLELFDTNDKRPYFKEYQFEKWGALDNWGGTVCFYNEQLGMCICDCVNHVMTASGFSNVISSRLLERCTYKFVKDNKENILLNGNFILPEFVDKIIETMPERGFVFKNNGRLFIANLSATIYSREPKAVIYPSEKGFPEDSVSDIKNYGSSLLFVFKEKDDKSGGEICCTFNFRQNKLIVYDGGYDMDVNGSQAKIDRLMSPQISEITERFNAMLKRINDVKF